MGLGFGPAVTAGAGTGTAPGIAVFVGVGVVGPELVCGRRGAGGPGVFEVFGEGLSGVVGGAAEELGRRGGGGGRGGAGGGRDAVAVAAGGGGSGGGFLRRVEGVLAFELGSQAVSLVHWVRWRGIRGHDDDVER